MTYGFIYSGWCRVSFEDAIEDDGAEFTVDVASIYLGESEGETPLEAWKNLLKRKSYLLEARLDFDQIECIITPDINLLPEQEAESIYNKLVSELRGDTDDE